MYNSIYPINIKPYVPPQNKNAVTNNAEEESAGSHLQRENRALQQSERKAQNRDTFQRQQYPNGQQTTIDYSKSQVNIAQIITDFKNTSLAIGTPDDVAERVNQYLSFAEMQSKEEAPDKEFIKNSLRSASKILDNYITQTLNKESKVVENWVEALFLQHVVYKSDPTSINPDFLVKLPEKTQTRQQQESQIVQEQSVEVSELSQQPVQSASAPNPVNPVDESATVSQQEPVEYQKDSTVKVYVPQDRELKEYFIQGKKYLEKNDTKSALNAFMSSLERAKITGDQEAIGMVCYEIGQIHDKEDNLTDALNYYHDTIEFSTNNNLKAKAYFAMGQIYDDVVYFDPAVEHYYASVSYAGEAENLKAQTKALGNIANMFAERYDKENTYTYLDVAKQIAEETKDNKTIGAVYSKSGDTLSIINEDVNALKDYKQSAMFYHEAESPAKMARNFEKASAIMLKLGNKTKAKSLLEKAYSLSIDADDREYTKTLSKKLLSV